MCCTLVYLLNYITTGGVLTLFLGVSEGFLGTLRPYLSPCEANTYASCCAYAYAVCIVEYTSIHITDYF